MRFLLAILMGLMVSQASLAGAPPRQTCEKDPAIIYGGDLVPWPWGSETRFPWNEIQGVWAPFSTDCDSYFIFQVGGVGADGERFVKITQYNPVMRKKIAEGYGYESDKVIYASMTGGAKRFNLTIRAFDTSVLKGELSSHSVATCDNQTVASVGSLVTASPTIVLTMYSSKRTRDDDGTSYQMSKLQSTPSLICQP